MDKKIPTNEFLIGKHVIVRSDMSGVHCGTLVESFMYGGQGGGDSVTLVNSRRLWRFSGAEDCSEIATLGLSEKGKVDSKISVPEAFVTCVSCETILCLESAYDSIMKAPYWCAGTMTPEKEEEVKRAVGEVMDFYAKAATSN